MQITFTLPTRKVRSSHYHVGRGVNYGALSYCAIADVTAPIAFAASVVVGDFEGYLHWFDAVTGDLQARTQAGSERITSQPLVLNDRLYALNDGGTLSAYEIVPGKKEE